MFFELKLSGPDTASVRYSTLVNYSPGESLIDIAGSLVLSFVANLDNAQRINIYRTARLYVATRRIKILVVKARVKHLLEHARERTARS